MKITKPWQLCALLVMCLHYSGLILIVLLHLKDTQILDCVVTEGQSQTLVFFCGANKRCDELHMLLHWLLHCFWLLSALLNKARWAGRDKRVWSHHTHNLKQCPGHQVYSCLPTYVYVGGETAPSTVITVVHLSESEECVFCMLNLGFQSLRVVTWAWLHTV